MRRWLQPRSYPTVVLLLTLALSSVLLAWLTFDLITLAMANVDFLRRHGIMAAAEGGALQLLLISGKGFGALLAYLGVRAIETEVLHRWVGRD